MMQRQQLTRIEEIGLRLLSASEMPLFREANVQGSPDERIKILQRWAALDHREEFTQKASAQIKTELPSLCSTTLAAIKGQLQEGALPAANRYLLSELGFCKEAIDEIPAMIESIKLSREKTLHELVEKIGTLQGLLKGRKLSKSLNHIISLRNRMNGLEADQVRLHIILHQIATPMRLFILTQQERMIQLNKSLLDTALAIKTEMKAISQEFNSSNVFVEKIGDRSDILAYFKEVQLNIKAKLFGWFETLHQGLVPAREALLHDQSGVDKAIDQHSIINRRPNVMIDAIGRADRIIAPYIDLVANPVNAPLHFTLISGYTGPVNLADALAGGANVTTTPSLSPNQVILAQVRLGLPIDQIAGLTDWRNAAHLKEAQKLFPLYTMDPSLLPAL